MGRRNIGGVKISQAWGWRSGQKKKNMQEDEKWHGLGEESIALRAARG